jgi:nitrogen fixation protein NifX
MRRLRLIDSFPPTDGKEIPGALKVAFATQDRRRVDAHFGSATTIVIYEVGPTGYRFVEAIAFDQVSGENGRHPDDGDDRVGAKVEAIVGCSILFSLAIGGMAAARVVNSRVYPLKLPSPEPIPDVIGRLQVMMRGAPPPWMRKLLHCETSLAFADE